MIPWFSEDRGRVYCLLVKKIAEFSSEFYEQGILTESKSHERSHNNEKSCDKSLIYCSFSK